MFSIIMFLVQIVKTVHVTTISTTKTNLKNKQYEKHKFKRKVDNWINTSALHDSCFTCPRSGGRLIRADDRSAHTRNRRFDRIRQVWYLLLRKKFHLLLKSRRRSSLLPKRRLKFRPGSSPLLRQSLKSRRRSSLLPKRRLKFRPRSSPLLRQSLKSRRRSSCCRSGA